MLNLFVWPLTTKKSRSNNRGCARSHYLLELIRNASILLTLHGLCCTYTRNWKEKSFNFRISFLTSESHEILSKFTVIDSLDCAFLPQVKVYSPAERDCIASCRAQKIRRTSFRSKVIGSIATLVRFFCRVAYRRRNTRDMSFIRGRDFD